MASDPSSSSSSTSSSSTQVISTKSSSSVSLHHLTTPIPLKLDDENFLLWKQQVLATVDGLLLSSFLDGTDVPPRRLSAADGTLTPNLAFISYKQQDNLLVAWLLAYMTTPILTKWWVLPLQHRFGKP